MTHAANSAANRIVPNKRISNMLVDARGEQSIRHITSEPTAWGSPCRACRRISSLMAHCPCNYYTLALVRLHVREKVFFDRLRVFEKVFYMPLRFYDLLDQTAARSSERIASSRAGKTDQSQDVAHHTEGSTVCSVMNASCGTQHPGFQTRSPLMVLGVRYTRNSTHLLR